MGALHHARRAGRHVPRGLQQRLRDHADPGLRDHRLRNDPRHAHHSARRPAACRCDIRLWNGDPRGHFEGNTLVVETTNFNDKGSIATSAATGRIRGIPHSEELHVVERFTRVSEDVINYEVTVTDPKIYTAPWTVALPLNRDPSYLMFEYACHEGNLALPNALHAGRVRERAAKATQ